FHTIKGRVLKVLPRIIPVIQPKKISEPYSEAHFVWELIRTMGIHRKAKLKQSEESPACFINRSIFLRARCLYSSMIYNSQQTVPATTSTPYNNVRRPIGLK